MNFSISVGIPIRTLRWHLERRPHLGGYWRCRRTIDETVAIPYFNKTPAHISRRQALRFGESVLQDCSVALERFRFLVDKCFGQYNADDNQRCIHITDIHELMFEAMLLVIFEDAEVSPGQYEELVEDWAYYIERYVGEFDWKAEEYHLKWYNHAFE